jgi:hypothetical protein
LRIESVARAGAATNFLMEMCRVPDETHFKVVRTSILPGHPVVDHQFLNCSLRDAERNRYFVHRYKFGSLSHFIHLSSQRTNGTEYFLSLVSRRRAVTLDCGLSPEGPARRQYGYLTAPS